MANKEQSYYTSTYAIPYGHASNLNTVDIHLPRESSDSISNGNNSRVSVPKYWILYLHGGAWRDPKQTSRDFDAALSYLPASEHNIAGLASINYRLSPHPNFPSEPGSADEKARSAVHPAHIEDVLGAIAYLQGRYEFGGRYILAGHSAGATLCFQAVMGIWKPLSDGSRVMAAIDLPQGIAGVCGIYDLPLLVRNHADVPMYRTFVESAFGTDEKKWNSASPVHGKYRETWPEGKAVVLAPSRDDILVEFAQAEAMSDCLWAEKRAGRRDVVIQLEGAHSDVVYQGQQLAKALIKCLQMVSNAG